MREHDPDPVIAFLWKVHDELGDAQSDFHPLVIKTSRSIGYKEKVELLNAGIGLDVFLLEAEGSGGL